MVGIVVVSHSAALADAAIKLAGIMLGDRQVQVLAAAGADGGADFGTDAALISQQVEAADDGEGVLVFVDLGSALMSTEMATEFLNPELVSRVRVSAAPLVEGLTAAAVAAAGGKDLSGVAAAAAEAVILKAREVAKLGDLTDPTLRSTGAADANGAVGSANAEGADAEFKAGADADVAGSGDWVSLEVLDPMGLHARPAAQLAACLGGFDADVVVHDPVSGDEADGASSMQLMALGVKGGGRMLLRASGAQADEALAAARQLVESGFATSPSA